MQPGLIITASGMRVNVLDPDPATIVLEDIASGLSRQSRFLGQIRRFYSVAEHSIYVALLCADGSLIKTALLHDATEAFLGDVPATLRALPAWSFYPALEDNLYRVIATKFGALYPIPEEVHRFDKLMRHPERTVLRGDVRDPEEFFALTKDFTVAQRVTLSWIGQHLAKREWGPKKARRKYLGGCESIGLI